MAQLLMDGTKVLTDPREHTRKWASRHPIYAGLIAGGLFYLVEILATRDPLGTVPFAVVIGAIFTLTSLGERRRRRKHNLPN
jgi:hypothetical protein